MAVSKNFQQVVASKPYVVLNERSHESLEQLGCELVAAGYDPQGGASTYVNEEGVRMWHQTFVRIVRETNGK